ncbi:hypothetical protein LTR50_004127 [Elasticomyces elasticus]|nr:hypothetical protein LTR50_004127 [Elasticomyces elasticus]
MGPLIFNGSARMSAILRIFTGTVSTSRVYSAPTHLPREDQDRHEQQHQRDLPLLHPPVLQARPVRPERNPTPVIRRMPSIRERDSHVDRAPETAALERVLDSLDAPPVLVLPHGLPSLLQPADKPAGGRDVGAGEGGEDGLADDQGGEGDEKAKGVAEGFLGGEGGKGLQGEAGE